MSSAAPARGRRRRHSDGAGHENEERWLLTYADMITLLLALFVVLFAISSVNVSKVKMLQQSLREAFSGKVMSGGEAIMQTGNSVSVRTLETQPRIVPNTPSLGQPPGAAAQAALAARREEDELQQLKRQLDAFAASHGFKAQVETVVTQRGLVVRLLTDNLLFDSGLADLKAQGLPLLSEVGTLLGVDRVHPIVVEGHTDDVPISTAKFASNWELSTARSAAVVRWLIGRSVPARRFSAAGYADLHPLASNGTDAGRARNRRVEIVLQRIHPLAPQDQLEPALAKGTTP
ncbi:MAG TPA: flagellar motor protein MotB [Conexibacter sp.]|jgi:chemotaxis protein MotB|nr:flagellar motor protein MotB [Conexibacter sp.]